MTTKISKSLLDETYLLAEGGELTGNLVVSKADPVMAFQPAAGSPPGAGSNIIFKDDTQSGFNRATINSAANGGLKLKVNDAVGVTQTELTLTSDGNVTVNALEPSAIDHLTRKDYVDGRNIEDLSNVTLVGSPAPANGEVLTYNGTNWINGTPAATGNNWIHANIGVDFSTTPTATAATAIAIGDRAVSGGTRSVAIGTRASSGTGTKNVAMGYFSKIGTNGNAVAIGPYAKSYGSSGISIGRNAQNLTNDNLAIAIGDDAWAFDASAIAIGDSATAGGGGSSSIAFGTDSSTDKAAQISIGTLVTPTSGGTLTTPYAVKIGYDGTTTASKHLMMMYDAGHFEITGDKAQLIFPNYAATGSPVDVPADAKEGAVIYDTVSNGLLMYAGSPPAWSAVSGAGITDHTLLSNIGTNTHAQIDTHIAAISPHNDWMNAHNGANFGATPTATGSRALAIGWLSSATATDAVAIGNKAHANTGGRNLAVGYYARASSGAAAIAIGSYAKAYGITSLAIGNRAKVSTGDNASIAIGDNAHCYDVSGIAIGDGATAVVGSNAAVILGYATSANLASQVHIGTSVTGTSGGTTSASHSVKIGYDGGTTASKQLLQLRDAGHLSLTGDKAQFVFPNYAAGSPLSYPADPDEGGVIYDSVTKELQVYGGSPAGWSAVGSASDNWMYANVGADFTVAPTGTGAYSISIGDSANTSTRVNAIAIGRDASCTQIDSVALGFGASATNQRAIAIGKDSSSSGLDSVVVGVGANAASQAVAVGYSASAGQTGTIAIGDNPTASSYQAIAMGTDTTANGNYAIVIGRQSTNAGHSAIVVGRNSSATATADDSIVIGTTSTATLSKQIVIGESLDGTSGSSNSDYDVKIGYDGTVTASKQVLRMFDAGKLELLGADAQIIFPNYAIGTGSPAITAPTNAIEGGTVYDSATKTLQVYGGSPAGWVGVLPTVSQEPDGATAEAFVMDTTNAFTTSGASILTLKTNAIEKVSFECNPNANDYYKIRFHDVEATQNNFYLGYSDTDTNFAGMFNDFGDFWLGITSDQKTYINFYNGTKVDLGASGNRQTITNYVGNTATDGLIVDGAIKTKKIIEQAGSFTTTGAISLNLDSASYFYNTATTGIITFTFTNPSATALTVSSFTVELFGGGTNAPVWPASVKWPGGTEPTWSTGIDIVSFVTRDGGTSWYGMLGGTAFA